MTVSLTATHQLPIDPFPRVQAVCLESMPQAKNWLHDLIHAEDYVFDGRSKLTVASGIIIESPQLPQVLAARSIEAIDERYHRQNLQFRRGPWHERPKEPATPKPEVAAKAAQPAKPKKPDGYITVAQIADELKVKPFDIRQALRNSGAVKPDFGWAFSPKEVTAIKKLVGGK